MITWQRQSNFNSAVGRVYFDGGLTEDGKIIRKSKTYRNIKENAPAENLYKALEQLAQLSESVHRCGYSGNIERN